jgi:uncharacterized membrane protein
MADAIFKQKEKTMKKFSWVDGTAIIIWLLPIVYLLSVFSSLPASIPVHFGIDGKPDRYGSHTEFLIGVSILSGITVLMFLLLKFLPFIDPKKTVKYSQSIFNKMALAIVIFLSTITIVIIYATAKNGSNISKLLFPLMGLFFAFLGNFMYNIKPNYFVGIRTPWTLESEATWKATHRLAGKFWFPGGILITIVTLFIPDKIGIIIFFIITAIITIIPIVYSYIYFKKLDSKK